MMQLGSVYLIPSLLDDDGINAMPSYLLDAAKNCQVFFVEKERTARRFLKRLSRDFNIDDYEWFTIHQAEEQVKQVFKDKLKAGKNVAIISEAGCPGIADPGQILIAVAQEMNAIVKPLVGPNSIILALMASGMNGQQFQFAGYLPIDAAECIKTVKDLEADAKKNKSTTIVIETPYRNNQLFELLLKTCMPTTRICVAADLTGINEWVKTKTVTEWKLHKPELHKRPVIFLFQPL